MKLIVATALLLCGSAFAANAETFTFHSTSHVVNSVMVTDDTMGQIGAVFNEGQAEGIYSTGEKLGSNSSCVAWTPQPGGPFTQQGACTYTETNGDKASIAFSCASDMKTGVGDCWGALHGISGRHAGKTGTISWHQTLDTDGKTGMAVGIGMWND